MRLGLVIYGSLATQSGGYLYDRRLVDYLQRQGDQVEIVSLPWRSYPRHLLDNLSPSLAKRLKNMQVDLLLQDELNHPSLFWLNHRLKRVLNYPVVSIVHHLRISELRPAWQNRLYAWVEKQYLTSLDGLIYNSHTTRQSVQALAPGVPEGVVAMPAADHLQPHVTHLEIEQRLAQPGPVRLIFVGNLIPRKGLHVLVNALAAVPQMDWSLTIAGSAEVDPDYAFALYRQSAESGLAGKINFAGSLSESDLAACLRSSHIMVIPSSYEGFGIVYLEGMGFGLPVIATTAGAAHELIQPDRNGFLVPPEDPGSLARLLKTLLPDRPQIARLGQQALAAYHAHPTWDQTSEKIRAYLRQVAS